MKNPIKKIAGGLMVAILVATIGVVLVGAETEDADETEDWHMPMIDGHKMFGHRGMTAELTEDQQAEIEELISDLTEEGASCEEIREAVYLKLDEMGILDDRLDNAIDQTEKRLEILNRENELRDQGYSWEEINEIIQEEFVLEHPIDTFHGFHRGFYENGEVPDFNSKESSIETTAI